MGCWIRSPGEIVNCSRLAKLITDHPRLDTGIVLFRVDFKNIVQVLNPVNHHRDIAALSGKTGPTAARKNGSAKLVARSDRLYYVFDGLRNNNADGHLPVVGTVNSVERFAAGIEANLAGHASTQFSF